MKMRLEQGHRMNQEQRLKQDQKQELALRLNLKLESLPPKEAIRGIEGINTADRILKEEGLVGVLIGSLAKKVWERTHDIEDFEKKDVDVIVLEQNYRDGKIEFNEGGIDWWLPKEKFISYKDQYGSETNINKKFFQNTNDVVLRFHIESDQEHNPGLHLLDLEQIIDMQFVESSSAINSKMIDDAVFEKFEANRKRFYQKVPSKHLMQSFGNKFIPFLTFDEVNGREIDAIEKEKNK